MVGMIRAPIDDTVREQLRAYDDLTALLLAGRGIEDAVEAEAFLNPSYADQIHDPLRMKNMTTAAMRFARAITAGERIAVWSDYDCDGIPGGVILHDFLKKAGAQFENYIPHRHLEGYGVNEEGIGQLHARGTKLIVTVDSGITDVDAVAKARALGMDVVVTDHHLPGETLPDAIVVNPNAHDDETYPFRALCGTGVAWKLINATLAVSPEVRARIPEGFEKWLLDMVALATIADMVPLTNENRVLAKYGLLVLRKSRRIGLARLCRAMRVDQGRMSEDDIGFMLAPRVNAASRMGDAREAFELFTTEDETRADALAKNLERLNRQRKALAGATTRAAHALLLERGTPREVIVLGDPSWRPSLLGLVANTLAETYDRPVFLWGHEGNGLVKGSCRSGGNRTNVVELMRAASDIFDEYGGHAVSGGFTVKAKRLSELEDVLIAARASLPVSESAELSATRIADAELAPSAITDALLATLARLAPFGEKNEKPIFLFKNIRIKNLSCFGASGEHIKLHIEDDRTMRTLEGVAFFARRALRSLDTRAAFPARAHVLAHIERDTFSRVPRARLRLVDVRLLD